MRKDTRKLNILYSDNYLWGDAEVYIDTYRDYRRYTILFNGEPVYCSPVISNENVNYEQFLGKVIAMLDKISIEYAGLARLIEDTLNEHDDKEKNKSYIIIQEVSERSINEIIDAYCEKKNPERGYFYCKCNNGRYVAIDNNVGECFTEGFKTKEEAISWLLGDDGDEL